MFRSLVGRLHSRYLIEFCCISLPAYFIHYLYYMCWRSLLECNRSIYLKIVQFSRKNDMFPSSSYTSCVSNQQSSNSLKQPWSSCWKLVLSGYIGPKHGDMFLKSNRVAFIVSLKLSRTWKSFTSSVLYSRSRYTSMQATGLY